MIVVVDDDEGVRGSCEIWLKAKGFSVRTAADGIDALSLLRERRPVAILLDVYMPEMDGLETLRHIRREFPQTPIIVMTGRSNSGCNVAKAAMAFGARTVLSKPFTGSELMSALEGCFDRVGDA